MAAISEYRAALHSKNVPKSLGHSDFMSIPSESTHAQTHLKDITEGGFVSSAQKQGRLRLKNRLKRYWSPGLPEKLVGNSSGRPIVMPIELAGNSQIRESPRSEW